MLRCTGITSKSPAQETGATRFFHRCKNCPYAS